MNARTPADAEDYLYAFFQNCYHLRDWLLGTYSQDAIDDFLKSTLPMRICRDVANLTKHFALDWIKGDVALFREITKGSTTLQT